MTQKRSRFARIAWAFVALIAAGSFAWFYSGYRSDIRQARERIAAGGQIAQTACGPIEYAIAGEGPPVLIVHGAGGGHDQGMDFGVYLEGRGYRVIAMSRFGYLRTPLPADASAEAQADAHACLLDALGIPRVSILGISAGAPSTMQFALRHPDRTAAMILMVPAAYVPRAGGAPSLKTPHWTQFLFDTALRSDFLFWCALRFADDLVARAILATPPEVVENASPREQALFNLVRQHILPISPRRLGLLNDAAVTSALPRYDLEKLIAPTLLISAVDDLFGTYDGARYTAEQLPDARFVGYPTGGHLLVGHHEEVLTEIEAFLHAAAGAGHQGKSLPL
jgi:pimeloyl-ACP methyl ester carboxylesterase